jgi:streptogramin lyase
MRPFACVLVAAALYGCAVKTVPGTLTDLSIPMGYGVTSSSLGEDGRLWYGFLTAENGPGIGSIGMDGAQTMADLSSSAYGYSINDIAVRRSGEVLLALACFPASVRCSAAGYARYTAGVKTPLARFRTGRGDGVPDGIALDGSGFWISDQRANAITHLTADGRQTTFHIPDAAFRPFGLVAAKAGIYVTGEERGKIFVLERGRRVRWIRMPDATSRLTNLAVGPDGSVWVAEYDADKIVSVSPTGTIHAYAVPTADANPDAVAVDEHGIAWFTEVATDRLGRVATDGSVRDALLPYGLSSPIFLFAGPSGTLYVMGSQSRWLGLYRTFVVARIPEATAFP